MDKRMVFQLNANRKVMGVLRGFDPFMNLVVEDAVEEISATEKHSLGTVNNRYSRGHHRGGRGEFQRGGFQRGGYQRQYSNDFQEGRGDFQRNDYFARNNNEFERNNNNFERPPFQRERTEFRNERNENFRNSDERNENFRNSEERSDFRNARSPQRNNYERPNYRPEMQRISQPQTNYQHYNQSSYHQHSQPQSTYHQYYNQQHQPYNPQRNDHYDRNYPQRYQARPRDYHRRGGSRANYSEYYRQYYEQENTRENENPKEEGEASEEADERREDVYHEEIKQENERIDEIGDYNEIGDKFEDVDHRQSVEIEVGNAQSKQNVEIDENQSSGNNETLIENVWNDQPIETSQIEDNVEKIEVQENIQIEIQENIQIKIQEKPDKIEIQENQQIETQEIPIQESQNQQDYQMATEDNDSPTFTHASLLQRIDDIDTELLTFNNQLQELEVKISTLPPSTESVAQMVLNENQQKVSIRKEQANHPHNPYFAYVQPLYLNPDKVAGVQKVIEQHSIVKPILHVVLFKRKQHINELLKSLTNRYASLEKTFKKKCSKHDSLFETRFDKLGQQSAKDLMVYAKRFASRVHPGMDLDLERCWDMENHHPDLRWTRTLAKLEPMLLEGPEKAFPFLDNNGLILDPLFSHSQNRNQRHWTEVEKRTFIESFLLYPKNFGKIASFLDNKSYGDCVAFYYAHKKELGLKKLLRAQNMKKRRVVQKKSGPGEKQSEWVGESSVEGEPKKKPRGRPRKEKEITGEQFRWTVIEKAKAVEGIRIYGKKFDKVAEFIGTKNEQQCRSFYQNYRKKLSLDTLIQRKTQETEDEDVRRDDDDQTLTEDEEEEEFVNENITVPPRSIFSLLNPVSPVIRPNSLLDICVDQVNFIVDNTLNSIK